MDNHALSPQVLTRAYSQGFFPMPSAATGEIQWYKPDPRAILDFDKFKVSRSLKKIINKEIFKISYSENFSDIMRLCSMRQETWITEDFIKSYTLMHKIGAAHSVEVWLDNEIVGGVYGISLGGAFFAESMFFKVSNASKVALYYLIEKLKQNNFILLECQFMTDHIKSLGAEEISDEKYQTILNKAIQLDVFFH